MANPLAAFGNAIMEMLSQVGEASRSNLMQDKFGPNWREDQAYTRATRSSDLRTREMTEARGRLTLADQLSNLIGTAAMGEADRAGDVQRTEAPITIGAEEGGRGYAANLPMAETVPPDPADVVPDDLGELTGFSREALTRLGLGKAGQSKRALAELKGDQTLAQIDARGNVARGLSDRRQTFQREMEVFKQAGREDLAELNGRLRERLAQYNQGKTDSRFQQNYSQEERHFYDRLNQSAAQWEQSQDLRELSARRQTLSAELDRDAGLSAEGKAQVIFELGIINGRLANMGLTPNATTPRTQPGAPGPRRPAARALPTGLPMDSPPGTMIEGPTGRLRFDGTEWKWVD